MLEKIMEKFQKIGLPRRNVNISYSDTWYSYTWNEYDVHLGIYAIIRNTLGGSIERIIIHEIAHSYICEFEPPRNIKKAFGNAQEWKSPQKMRMYFSGKGETKYGSTHPNEDMCECLTNMVRGIRINNNKKREALEKWLKTVC